MLRLAQQRHRALPKLLGKLVISDSTKATLGRMVSEGHLRREGTGHVLTPQGEMRLDYLYTTQVLDPYLREVKRLHGDSVARQLRRELR